MADFQKKLQNLKGRREDIITKALSVSNSFNKTEFGTSVKYAFEAMESISESYTQNTYSACEKVKAQLQPGLLEYGIPVEFRYQGSVPTNTHIKVYSDIDMLTLDDRFYSLQPPQTTPDPYKGEPLNDLKDMRSKIYRILDTVYPACEIDNTGSKCVSISGGSLNRKIDIIPSNWFNSLAYRDNPLEVIRGIQILDLEKNERIINFPFLHIYWINQKDNLVNGGEKKVIRLLKSLKVDADEKIDVSSYDIASLVYRMDNEDLSINSWERQKLIQNTNRFLLKVINDSSFRNNLEVANGTRKIFCAEGAKLVEVVKLQKELNTLELEIALELKITHRALEMSNIFY